MKKITLSLTLVLICTALVAQTDYAYETFDDTRIVNGHSVETKNEGILTFIIAHRFGPMTSGRNNLWGLDFARMRMGLDYGITNKLMVGLGRTSTDGTIDGYVKYKFLSQSSGERSMPISATFLGGYALETKAVHPNPDLELDLSQKSSYVAQILIARKLGDKLSLQVMPTFLHRNLVADDEENDIFAVGFAGQYQFLKNWSVSTEYYLTPKSSLPNNPDGNDFQQSLSFSVQIDTKGHIFQLHISNSQGMVERTFISESEGDWQDGKFLKRDIFFGFNITRDFKIKGRKIR
ncbi:MAG: hypothetical protein JXR03_16900 [Cyclobacteriaceae bacterium]